MRILFLSNLFPPHELGGYGQLCQEVAVALQARGHTIHILTSRHQKSNDDSPSPLEKEHSDSSNQRLDVTRTLYLQADIQHYQPVHFLRNFQREEAHNLNTLTSLVDSFRPDLIFVWGMWNLSPLLPKLAETLLPDRVAYYICSYWPTDEDIHLAYWDQPTRKIHTALIKKMLGQLAQRNFRTLDYPPQLMLTDAACVSRYVRDTLVEADALPLSARVIYNGGDMTPFFREIPADEDSSPTAPSPIAAPPTEQEPLQLLYFGRLIADKGAHTAFEALAHLRKDGHAERVRLTVLGNGRDDYMSDLRRFALENEIDHLIHYHEGVPRDEVPAWLKKHDVFLFTSVWAEPLARSVMEAMMAGMLVIGSAVGGQTEMMVDGENALTYQAGDSIGLAFQILKSLGDPKSRRTMARNGQTMVQSRFTHKRMIDEMETWLIGLFDRYRYGSAATLKHWS